MRGEYSIEETSLQEGAMREKHWLTKKLFRPKPAKLKWRRMGLSFSRKALWLFVLKTVEGKSGWHKAVSFGGQYAMLDL